VPLTHGSRQARLVLACVAVDEGVLAAAVGDPGARSVLKTKYRIEFYANDNCSAASVTEAQTYLASTVINTDANGHKDDTTPITLPAGAGSHVSMTAAMLERVLTALFPPTFTLVSRSTSEVSPCETI
jgi:hypothetical protein